MISLSRESYEWERPVLSQVEGARVRANWKDTTLTSILSLQKEGEEELPEAASENIFVLGHLDCSLNTVMKTLLGA